MKKEGKKFHLGDILSVITGKILPPRGIEGAADLLDYLSNNKLFRHQLAGFGPECIPKILEQHPQLKEVDPSSVNSKNYKKWLAKQVAKYGEYLELRPLSQDEYTLKDPIEELEEMLGKERIIVVVK